MRCLITGAAGYLGSTLCGLLLADGREVVAVDNLRYNQTSLAIYCSNPKFTFHRMDCADIIFNKLADGCDFIIPLAAIVGATACDRYPTEAWRVNLHGVNLAITAAKAVGAGIIYPNSNSGYGTRKEICTEETPLRPISIYGKSKAKAETLVLKAGGISFRFATLMGVSPRMRFDLLTNDFTQRAVRDGYLIVFEGSFKRNYLHVRDAAAVFLWAIEHYDEMKGQVYNVGLPDVNLTKLELCEKIKARLPNFYYREAPIGEDPDKRSYVISNERILKTGWQPRFSIDDAIIEVIKACPMYQQSPWSNV